MFEFLSLKFYAFSGLVNFITALVLAGIVLYKNPKVPTNRIFSLFSFSVAFWSIFYFIWLNTTDKLWAEFYLRTCMIGVLFMPSLFIHFVDNLLQIKRNKKFYIFNYLLSIIFTLTVYTSLYAHDIGPHLVFPYWLLPGPAFHLAISHFGIIVIYSFVLMAKSMAKTKGIVRNQLLYVFIGTAIGYIAGSTNYSCWYRLPIPPFLNILVSVYVGFVACAIAKYNLMGLDVAIKNFIARTFSLICLAFFVIGSIFILDKFITLTLFSITFAATGLSVLLYPISKMIELWTSQAIRPRPDFQAILKDYTEVEIMSQHTSKGLAELVVTRITDSLSPSVCSLMLLDEETGLYNIIASSGKDEEIKTIAFKQNNHLILALKNTHQARLIVKDELSKIFSEADVNLIKRDLEILKSQITIPLILQEKLLGLVNLGPKSSGELYTPEEIGFLFIFLTQSAFMMQFLDKVQKIHELEVKEERLAGITNLLVSFNHEMRNQLNNMQLPIMSGVEKMISTSDLERSRQIAQEASSTMTMILNAVQDYHENCEVTSAVPTDISTSIEESLARLKPKFDQIEAKITIDIAQGLPKIKAYPTFANLFFNLFVNCYFALVGKKTRLLNIKAYQTKDTQRPIEITITDTGGDMLKAMQQDALTSGGSGGREFPERANIGGVNFFIAKHIIDDHQGELIVSTNLPAAHDEQPGTIFTIRLPLIQKQK